MEIITSIHMEYVSHLCESQNKGWNGKVLCPITSSHESNLDHNYSNLHSEKQVSSDDEWSSSHNNKAYNFGDVQTISLEKY